MQITAEDFRSKDNLINVAAGTPPIKDPRQLNNLVITVYNNRPVFLKEENISVPAGNYCNRQGKRDQCSSLGRR